MDQSQKADLLRRLHGEPSLLVLPNAWDVASAKVLAALPGCRALATSSAAVAHSLGWEDGEQAPRDEMVEAAGRTRGPSMSPSRPTTRPATAILSALRGRRGRRASSA
jgi:2-methylisocitrate lyase-like PEP mutase family enzyme